MYTKVHVALDGSKQAKGAAGLGLELAKGMGARLVAVHVDAPSRLENRVARLRAALPTDALMSDESRVLEKKGRVRTGWLADEADDAGISFASERHAGLPHEALLDHMANFQDDLLILGSCGQSGDVNDDGYSDGFDIGAMSGDVNGDGTNDILDVVTMINNILYNNNF